MAELKKPKSPPKKVERAESEKKVATATKTLLKEIADRQNTDSNNG